MSEIASKGQLRLAYLRWAVVTVPFILLLGITSLRLLPIGSANAWYAGLARPEGLPPEWAFAAGWAAMYVLLGLALAMIINARGSMLRGRAILFFALAMAASLAWPILFFGMHRPLWALGALGAALLLALGALALFGRIRGGAAWLMLPWIAWLGYGCFLLYEIGRLNPDAGLAPARATDQIRIL